MILGFGSVLLKIIIGFWILLVIMILFLGIEFRFVGDLGLVLYGYSFFLYGIILFVFG